MHYSSILSTGMVIISLFSVAAAVIPEVLYYIGQAEIDEVKTNGIKTQRHGGFTPPPPPNGVYARLRVRQTKGSKTFKTWSFPVYAARQDIPPSHIQKGQRISKDSKPTDTWDFGDTVTN
ncbi:hypothetical protein PpBr36_08201 [Pyricularia pennisetigena]|uniref:hypothetical protein n=1 Tax=Pyricularia pennisetigena TaxID=1578925 RepID=UPI00114EDE1C|nr:hypothetical protein PpBr36_08201 [Pyricularia pennisetigena]TLS23807.1 hypothetical protein PpBr36_08201 [Pyricularia pennisetigena]